MAASSMEWNESIAELKTLVQDCGELEPVVKHMIEQAWLASQQGELDQARDLLTQAKTAIEA